MYWQCIHFRALIIYNKTMKEMRAMNNRLATNIRTFRKSKGLTQEQLAEVFDVTVGAVHKWEAGLSTPELGMIMEIADFFDTSLDVLIGFDVRDNRIESLATRIKDITRTRESEGAAEAEKALKKYPHSFEIVVACADYYNSFGTTNNDRKFNLRAKELYEQAIRLISQNTDPYLNEAVLYGRLATVCFSLGEFDKGLEIYKAHNAGGMFDVQIGQLLIANERFEEADTHLSYALMRQIGERYNLMISKAFIYMKTGRIDDAIALLEETLRENNVFKTGNTHSFSDKMDCIFLTGLSYGMLVKNKKKEAREYLLKAKETSESFDADPNYDCANFRFSNLETTYAGYDSMGTTARETIMGTIDKIESQELQELWNSIN